MRTPGPSRSNVVNSLLGLAVFSFGVLGAIVLMVSVNVAGTLAFTFALRHHRSPLRSPDLELMRSMLRYGGRIYLATLLAYLVGRANLLLVNSYLGGVAAQPFEAGGLRREILVEAGEHRALQGRRRALAAQQPQHGCRGDAGAEIGRAAERA